MPKTYPCFFLKRLNSELMCPLLQCMMGFLLAIYFTFMEMRIWAAIDMYSRHFCNHTFCFHSLYKTNQRFNVNNSLISHFTDTFYLLGIDSSLSVLLIHKQADVHHTVAIGCVHWIQATRRLSGQCYSGPKDQSNVCNSEEETKLHRSQKWICH